MKKSLEVQPYLFPMPVLIIATYGKDGKPDAMNAAWGMIADYKKIVLFLDGNHKTTKNIRTTKAFTVSVATESTVVPSDFVGIVSGNNDAHKMEKSGFTLSKSKTVNAPIINELPFVLECELDHIDEEMGAVYGNIKNILADESILQDGKIDIKKLKPICYDSSMHGYYAIGEKVGQAFSDGMKLK